MSHTDIVDFRAQQTSFESITTFTSYTPLISGAGEPARVSGALVGDDFFNVMGTQPFLGRGFLPEEQHDGKDQVVVLSYELWQRQLNSDPNALGARLGNIFGLVMTNALGLAVAGILLGTVGAFALTRLLKSLLFGVAPTDLTTFVLVCVGVGVVALVASFLPARRATKVDPLVALRNE